VTYQALACGSQACSGLVPDEQPPPQLFLQCANGSGVAGRRVAIKLPVAATIKNVRARLMSIGLYEYV
jgi:hypothetical protein